MINGKLIREKRAEKGMSQDDLARICGYEDRSAISRIETGLQDDLPLSKAVQIAKVLGITPTQLTKEANDGKDTK